MNIVKWWKITKNKVLEFQLTWFGNSNTISFDINVWWQYKGDHKGFNIEITIVKLLIAVFFYDRRHEDEM